MKRRSSLFRARLLRCGRLLLAYAAFGTAVTLGVGIWITWHILEPLVERLAAFAYYPEG